MTMNTFVLEHLFKFLKRKTARQAAAVFCKDPYIYWNNSSNNN